MIKASFILSIALTLILGILSFREKNFVFFFTQNLLSEFKLSAQPDFRIQVNKLGFKKLDMMASKSIENGFLKDESREWVSCNVVKNNLSTPCKIRLRGDLPKHWQGIKRSYRIKFKEASPFWGWKKVDLILPDDKGHESEIVAYEISKKLELISPGAKFSNISINGVNTGTYFIKQGDSGSLFEMNGRTESLLIKENNIWWYAQNAGGIYNPLFNVGQWDTSNLRSLPILYSPVFQGKAASESTYSRFAKMLELSYQGENLDHYIHKKSFYSWLAIVMTFGTIHSTLPDNMLWYVNGSTGLSEPLIYDVLPSKLWGDPFQFFQMKSRLIRNIMKQTWKSGGKAEFEKALSVIENNIISIYDRNIQDRKKQHDPYSLNEANRRKNDVLSNVELIKNYLPKTNF